MAITRITTNLGDTPLGNPVSDDGIAMLISVATTQNNTDTGLTFALNTPYLILSPQDLNNYGITEAINPTLVFNVNEFFEKAGNGSKLWIVGAPRTLSGVMSLINNDLENIVSDTAKSDFDNRPRFIGFAGEIGLIENIAADNPLQDDVIDIAQALQTQLTNMFRNSYRMSGYVDAIALYTAAAGISKGSAITDLQSGIALNAPRVSIVLTTTTPNQTASIGQVLGVQSSIALNISIGAVTTVGQVSTFGYFLDYNSTSNSYINTDVSDLTNTQYDLLGAKQYVFTRTRPQKSGVYYNDGATLNDPTNALSSQEFVRVGNKVCDSVEAYFVNLIGEPIPTVVSTGAIDPAFKASELDELARRYLNPLVDAGIARQISVDFWAKDGNFIASRAIEVQVRIVPMAALREIYIEVFYVSVID